MKAHQYRGIAQQVEQRSPKPRAEGSIPSAPAIVNYGSSVFINLNGSVVQLVRTPACHAGGRGFKSLPSRHLIVSANVSCLNKLPESFRGRGNSRPSLF